MENPNDTNPENPSEDADSLKDWINRAKRAHELVDAIDLKKVAKHDAVEVAKVETVSDALGDLEDGKEITHVEGVDEVVSHDASGHHEKAALVELIDKLGWSDRINRVLYHHAELCEFKPLELIPHFEGLPEFDVCLAPTQSNSVGYFGLFITKSGLFAATIQDPPSKHHWQIAQSRPYDDQTELITSLRQFSQSAFE